MGLLSNLGITRAAKITPRPQMGGLNDIPCGQYQKGRKGDWLLSGGYSNFMGLASKPNMFKTWLSLSEGVRIAARYEDSEFLMYDTEATAGWNRLENAFTSMGHTTFDDDVEARRIILVTSNDLDGSDFWTEYGKFAKAMLKVPKKDKFETPFLDHDGKSIYRHRISTWMIDSLSTFQTAKLMEIIEENSIDSGTANTYSLRGGNFKSKLMIQAGKLSNDSNSHLVMTAHIGKEFQLDPRAHPVKQLRHMENGMKYKNVPENFGFLSSVARVIEKSVPCAHSDKSVKYPRPGEKKAGVDAVDLMELQIMFIRNKHGQTGGRIPQIISQSEGWKPALSEYHYCGVEKWGYVESGQRNDRHFDLMPDFKVTRLTVADLCDTNRKLQRCLEITSEWRQMREHMFSDLPSSFMEYTMADVYAKLVERGYNMDMLLLTRGFWTCDHYKQKAFKTAEDLEAFEHVRDLPPLSTRDIFEMIEDRYIPWWYPDKKSIKVLK